ncbi:hypothetical protein LCGC14_1974280 [marine sediment metagenome]|uniref:Uncharacterized protein n=1 Tax=marine sediment metagenome TaxID=412755 RepID=A0A0F9FYZ8_9ZZZZ
MNKRDLTKEEINSLSLELQCCFFLQGWNISVDINTEDDWIDAFWVFNTYDANVLHPSSEEVERRSLRKKKDELIKFVKGLLYCGRF